MVSPEVLIFDRNLLLQRRSNIASSLRKSDFLIKRSLDDIIEKLSEMGRKFPFVLNFGCRTGYGSSFLQNRPDTIQVVETDFSFNLLKNSSHPYKIVCDEEYLPFAENKFDLIVSTLNLHHVNDLPGCLIQLRRILKPNGLLIASMFGERNLSSLSEILTSTELEFSDGISPRISPTVEIKQLGALLQRTGFSSPVIDKDSIEVHYANPTDLLHDLQNMGETNIMLKRNKNYSGKKLWQKFSQHHDFITKFEILTLTASKN